MYLSIEKTWPAIIEQILRELLHSGPAHGEEQIRLLAQQTWAEDSEALVFLFLEISRCLKYSAPALSNPSGMITPRLKASIQTGKKSRKKKEAGGQPDYPGHHLPMLTAYWHYAQVLTLAQIQGHPRLSSVSPGRKGV